MSREIDREHCRRVDVEQVSGAFRKAFRQGQLKNRYLLQEPHRVPAGEVSPADLLFFQKKKNHRAVAFSSVAQPEPNFYFLIIEDRFFGTR